MITLEQLVAAAGSKPAVARNWLEPLNVAMTRFGILSKNQIVAFLAECGHESAGLTRVVENLNYTPKGLMATFNNRRITRFSAADAEKYGRTDAHPANQQMIANIAYANRMGNGPASSGDGWHTRGRGPGQLTGTENYRKCGHALGIDLLANPVLLERPDVGSLAFAWFFVEGNPHGINLNELADAGDIDAISRIVNGGENGIVERRALYESGLQAFA